MPNYNYGNYPYGMPYQPNFPQQNNMNMYQQQVQTNQYAFVNGLEGAKSFQMQPNQTMLLMDSDNPLCYMKTSNNLGQSTLRYFRLTEISESELKNNNNNTTKEFASKEDFEILSKRIDEIAKKIEGETNEQKSV